MNLFKCLFRKYRWCHNLGFPQNEIHTCRDCGAKFPMLTKLTVDKRFRRKQKMVASGWPKVAVIRKVKEKK